MNYRERITIEPGKRGGKPGLRGLRFTIYEVHDYLASGMSYDEVGCGVLTGTGISGWGHSWG